MIWFFSVLFHPRPECLCIFQVQLKKTRNGSDKPYAHGPLEGKHMACMISTTHKHREQQQVFMAPFGSVSALKYVFVPDSSSILFCFTDHCVRSGALPGQAHGVHCQLPEHHGVRDGEHPFPEGRVWRVRTQRSSLHLWED